MPRRPLLVLPRPDHVGRLLAPNKVRIDDVIRHEHLADMSLGLGPIEQDDIGPSERLVAPPAAEHRLGRDDVRGRDAGPAHVHVLEEVGDVLFAERNLAA